MSREDDIAAILKALDEYRQPLPLSDAEAERVGAYIDAAARRMVKERPMPNSQPKLEPTINYGQIGTMVTTLVAVGGMLWHFSAAQAENRRDIDSLLARSAVYAPRVDLIEQSNKVQDERLQNTSFAIVEIRKAQGDLMAIMGTMREDLATIKAWGRPPSAPPR